MAKRLETQLEEAKAELKEVDKEIKRMETELDLDGLDEAHDAARRASFDAEEAVRKITKRELRRALGYGESTSDAVVEARLRLLVCQWAGLTKEDVEVGADTHGNKVLGVEAQPIVTQVIHNRLKHPELTKARQEEKAADQRVGEAWRKLIEARHELSGPRLRYSRLKGRIRDIQDKIARREDRKRYSASASTKSEEAPPPRTDKQHQVEARKKLRTLTGYGIGGSRWMTRDSTKTARADLAKWLAKELKL